MKPAGYWIKGGEIHPKTASEDNITAIDNQYDVLARSDFPLPGEDDAEETVLYEEQFVLPATPSETSLSDREYGEDDQEETPDQSKGTVLQNKVISATTLDAVMYVVFKFFYGLKIF